MNADCLNELAHFTATNVGTEGGFYTNGGKLEYFYEEKTEDYSIKL